MKWEWRRMVLVDSFAIGMYDYGLDGDRNRPNPARQVGTGEPSTGVNPDSSQEGQLFQP
jgi:hypothetical protein